MCGFQVRFGEEGKENIWFGGMSTKTRLFHTYLKMRLSSNLFRTLYAIKNINPATNTNYISLRLLLMPPTGMTARQMSRRMQLGLPWPLGMTQRAMITKDASDGTKITTSLLLSCNNNTLLTAGSGKNNLKRRRQMRWLDSLTLAAQRYTSW